LETGFLLFTKNPVSKAETGLSVLLYKVRTGSDAVTTFLFACLSALPLSQVYR
jgi:hypothetical protein